MSDHPHEWDYADAALGERDGGTTPAPGMPSFMRSDSGGTWNDGSHRALKRSSQIDHLWRKVDDQKEVLLDLLHARQAHHLESSQPFCVG